MCSVGMTPEKEILRFSCCGICYHPPSFSEVAQSEYQSKMGTFRKKKKQRPQSEINAHHTSKSVKLKCILQQRIKKEKKEKKNGNGRRVLKVYQLSEMLRLVPFMLQSVPCSDVLLKIDYILF